MQLFAEHQKEIDFFNEEHTINLFLAISPKYTRTWKNWSTFSSCYSFPPKPSPAKHNKYYNTYTRRAIVNSTELLFQHFHRYKYIFPPFKGTLKIGDAVPLRMRCKWFLFKVANKKQNKTKQKQKGCVVLFFLFSLFFLLLSLLRVFLNLLAQQN